MKTIEHWIGGAGVSGVSARTADVYDPATGQVQAQVLLAEPADIDDAVQTARKAYQAWQDVSLTRRARIKPKPIAERTFTYLNANGPGPGGAA